MLKDKNIDVAVLSEGEMTLSEILKMSLKNNNQFFVFTTPLNSKHPGSDWLKKHGDGVFDIALSVDCDETAYKSCLSRGAEGFGKQLFIEEKCRHHSTMMSIYRSHYNGQLRR